MHPQSNDELIDSIEGLTDYERAFLKTKPVRELKR